MRSHDVGNVRHRAAGRGRAVGAAAQAQHPPHGPVPDTGSRARGTARDPRRGRSARGQACQGGLQKDTVRRLTGAQPVGEALTAGARQGEAWGVLACVTSRSAAGRRPAKSRTGALPSRCRGPKAYAGTPSTAVSAPRRVQRRRPSRASGSMASRLSASRTRSSTVSARRGGAAGRRPVSRHPATRPDVVGEHLVGDRTAAGVPLLVAGPQARPFVVVRRLAALSQVRGGGQEQVVGPGSRRTFDLRPARAAAQATGRSRAAPRVVAEPWPSPRSRGGEGALPPPGGRVRVRARGDD